MRKTITLLLLALLSISYARGAEGDVTTNADIDFSGSITGTSPYTIAGTVGSMTWTQQWTYAPAIVDGILQFGNFNGGVVALQGNAVGNRDVVTIKFDLAFGKLNGKHVGFKFVDKDGNNILEQLFDAYNADFDNANPLGLDWEYMYHGSNTVIQERCVNFTITLDYAEQKITTNTTCLLSGAGKSATTGKFEVSMPSNVGTIAQFVLEGNINNTARYATLDNLKITTTEGNYEVELPAYTINYIYGNNTIKTTNGNLAAGTKVEAENPIVIDNVRYFAADGVTTSLTLSDDADKNVLDVNLRLPYTFNYTVNAVDGSNNVLGTLASGSYTEGDAAISLAYPRYILSGTTIYASGTGAFTYSTSFTPNADNYIQTITYNSGTVNDVVYYTEGEGVSGVSEGTNVRASVGKMGHTGGSENYIDVTTVEPGKYKIYMRGQNGNKDARAFNFKVGDEVVFTGSIDQGTNQDHNSEDFNVLVNSTLSFASEGSNQSGVDYFYLVRTGDVTEEKITVATEGTSTYVTTYPLDFSTVGGLTVLIATGETQGYVELSKVTQVPAGAPIIVKGVAGNYNVPVCDATTYSDGETDGLTNKLEGNATTSYTVKAGDNIYAIKKDKSEFRPVAADVEIPAKKAYFRSEYPINTNADAKPYIIRGEEEDPTAVTTVEVVEAAKAKKFFNAAGQQVDENYKGFVITSAGKKIINK